MHNVSAPYGRLRVRIAMLRAGDYIGVNVYYNILLFGLSLF